MECEEMTVFDVSYIQQPIEVPVVMKFRRVSHNGVVKIHNTKNTRCNSYIGLQYRRQ